jgi:hypothetical protein
VHARERLCSVYEKVKEGRGKKQNFRFEIKKRQYIKTSLTIKNCSHTVIRPSVRLLCYRRARLAVRKKKKNEYLRHVVCTAGRHSPRLHVCLFLVLFFSDF